MERSSPRERFCISPTMSSSGPRRSSNAETAASQSPLPAAAIAQAVEKNGGKKKRVRQARGEERAEWMIHGGFRQMSQRPRRRILVGRQRPPQKTSNGDGFYHKRSGWRRCGSVKDQGTHSLHPFLSFSLSPESPRRLEPPHTHSWAAAALGLFSSYHPEPFYSCFVFVPHQVWTCLKCRRLALSLFVRILRLDRPKFHLSRSGLTVACAQCVRVSVYVRVCACVSDSRPAFLLPHTLSSSPPPLSVCSPPFVCLVRLRPTLWPPALGQRDTAHRWPPYMSALAARGPLSTRAVPRLLVINHRVIVEG